jgi:CMP-N,N'-diacetyllegionaminic acid synthase
MVESILALIPARGGSKGIPRKNLALVGGRPLIAWSIESARAARAQPRVVVSTEDTEIARVAAAYGAEVPFLRPVELASDQAPGEAPVLHALEWLRTHEGWEPDLVMCLQPTSPLRSAEDIDASIARLEALNADSVVSVAVASPHPFWMKRLDAKGWIRPFMPDVPAMRRQELPPVYALNGAIYLARRGTFLAAKGFYSDRTCGYLMPAERSLDVDAPWDLELADLMLRARPR